MSLATTEPTRSPIPVVIVAGSLLALTVGVASGVSTRAVLAVVVFATLATLARVEFVAWPHAIAAMILIILMIPIRRFSFPGNLPFQLEPYRVYVALLVLVWAAALLADPRIRLRRSGFEGPLIVIVGSSFVSIAANRGRVAQSPDVAKTLMFFLSFVLVLYVIVSVVRRLDSVDFLAKTLVGGGAILAGFAVVEARTGYNVFNHINRVMPFLRPDAIVEPGGFLRYGSGTLRVFGSAQHPIALSAVLVMLTPLAIYLAQRYRQRRWILCAIALVVACAATVSRTGIIMLVVVGVVFLVLRPRETVRLWPAVLVALIVIKVAMPGTLGAIRHSFLPPGGLIAEQEVQPGTIGSGRLADLGPALHVWARNQPLTGQGYGTYISIHPNDPDAPLADILDNQWLGTLLATGAVGLFGWLWFFVRAVRRFGAEARLDESDRGWLLVSITAGVAAYAVGMLTYDAFSFIQITFLLFIFVGLGSALTDERPIPLAVKARRERVDAKAIPADGPPHRRFG